MNLLAYFDGNSNAVSEQSTAQSVAIDHQRYIRLGWAVILGGVLTFFIWASVAPLDQGVPMSWTVTVESSSKAIQHSTGGTVEAILVREGQQVRAGDVLVRMNAVQSTADVGTARAQYFTAAAATARLLAERDGLRSLTLPAELNVFSDNATFAQAWKVQQQLFTSRRASRLGEVAALQESIEGLRLQARGLEQAVASKQQQLDYMEEQLVGVRGLSRDGFVARNRLLDLEQSRAQTNSALAADTGTLGRTRRQIAELELTRGQRAQAFQEQVRTQLAEAQSQTSALGSRLTGLDHSLSNEVLRAPVDGVVMGLSVFAPGAVVGPGMKLMDIVPSDDPLVVEGRLPVHLVDNIGPGLAVELMFSAFNQNTTPHIPGEVIRVSADRLVDERTGEPYFKALVKATPEGMRLLKDQRVQAGMPVDLFVKTGERTLAGYLLKPLADHLKMSMSED
jgi:protease secretion system membrane fusion protein